jgi:hypothetical protein
MIFVTSNGQFSCLVPLIFPQAHFLFINNCYLPNYRGKMVTKV